MFSWKIDGLFFLTLLLLPIPPHCALADWIVSGSPDGTASFSVDDDLDIFVNGTLT
jgi:hypothetical protein